MALKVEYNVIEKGKDSNTYRLIGGPDPKDKQTFEQLEYFMKQALIAVSRDAIREEVSRGFPRNYRSIVDGRPGKALTKIKPFGKATFVAPENIKRIIMSIWDTLQGRSPQDTGLYKSLHVVTFNGEEIATNREELRRFLNAPRRALDAKDRFRFFNEAPYARKLERYGVTGQKIRSTFRKSKDKKLRSGIKVRKPSGTYAITFRAMKRRFGRNVKMKFEMLPGPEIGRTSPLSGTQDGGYPWRAKYFPRGGFYLYPTISVDVAPEGINQPKARTIQ